MIDSRIHCSYDPARPTVWRLEKDYTRRDVTAKEGFLWDGASIPRGLWNLLPPWGSYSGAALIHDWLYANRIGHRSDADNLFLELMVEDKVPTEQAIMMYRAVRLFGSDCWNIQDKPTITSLRDNYVPQAAR